MRRRSRKCIETKSSLCFSTWDAIFSTTGRVSHGAVVPAMVTQGLLAEGLYVHIRMIDEMVVRKATPKEDCIQ